MNHPPNRYDGTNPFWVFCPMDRELFFFKTEKERDEWTDKTLIHDYHKDFSTGAWSEEVADIIAGVVTHKVVEFNREERPTKPEGYPCACPCNECEAEEDCSEAGWDDGWEDPDIEWKCDYRLEATS